ncbi:unnamed protein product [Vitrella brassicaformis CCMP3155]|uniref:Secreted protein n=1 Tax=Vitrella brassicaformis (strain CCMP3155) TaxID=1169540 RepID=A0A0G4FHR8_VITBC|nr:unnamed protein product [Vitrella brassicaformis CCMP3155]|eukprot:CEM12615.1 unnamed protein product [Vitrella brassicaformis CCMP3155]
MVHPPALLLLFEALRLLEEPAAPQQPLLSGSNTHHEAHDKQPRVRTPTGPLHAPTTRPQHDPPPKPAPAAIPHSQVAMMRVARWPTRSEVGGPASCLSRQPLHREMGRVAKSLVVMTVSSAGLN